MIRIIRIAVTFLTIILSLTNFIVQSQIQADADSNSLSSPPPAQSTMSLSTIALFNQYNQQVGVAMQSFDGTTHVVGIAAALKTPPEGSYYQAWLSNAANEFQPLGKLEHKQGQYELTYQAPQQSELYKTIVVSVEKDSLFSFLNKPSELILRGQFR